MSRTNVQPRQIREPVERLNNIANYNKYLDHDKALDALMGDGVAAPDEAITSLVRTITHNAADAVVVATKTWSFVNGAFTAADVGRRLVVAGTTAGSNNGTFVIASVTNATTIVTATAPGGSNETFGVGVTQALHHPSLAITHNASDAVTKATKTFHFVNGTFTVSDVGRKLVVQGTANSGANDGIYTIATVVNATDVTVTEALAADETFGAGVTQTMISATCVLSGGVPVSLLSSVVSQVFALGVGTYIGQIHKVRVIVGTTTTTLRIPKFADGKTVTSTSTADSLQFMWNGMAWRCAKNIGTPASIA
jgi:hypothetical protein